MQITPTHDEQMKRLDAVLINAKYGIGLSPDEFKLFIDWLGSIPLNLASPNPDELNALKSQMIRVIQDKFIPK